MELAILMTQTIESTAKAEDRGREKVLLGQKALQNVSLYGRSEISRACERYGHAPHPNLYKFLSCTLVFLT